MCACSLAYALVKILLLSGFVKIGPHYIHGASLRLVLILAVINSFFLLQPPKHCNSRYSPLFPANLATFRVL